MYLTLNLQYRTDDEEGIRRWIDGYTTDDGTVMLPNISAQLPPTTGADDTDINNRLNKCISKHMLHKCAVASNGCKKKEDSVCKRGYESTCVRESTGFNEKGFPVYKRTAPCDLNVVASSPSLMLDWDGHVNVEFSANSRCVLYLYDYLYKGTT
jgi:hypothetical protein